MDILLVGSLGTLMQRLVDKLDKEKHRVFILTEEGKEIPSCRRAFETYRFDYEDVCTREVFASVKPDVTLFFGAYDTNFHWEDRKSVIAKYSASLLNMLVAYSAVGKGRFLYLSSDVVFHGITVGSDGQVMNHVADNPKAQSVAMGEKVCEDYRTMMGADVVVLRLDHLYGIPKYPREMDDVCARMIMEALETGEIALDGGGTMRVEDELGVPETIAAGNFTVDSEKRYSLLAIPDAVDFIYQVAAAKECGHSLYQISRHYTITQTQIAELIQGSLRGADGRETVALAEQTEKKTDSVVLTEHAFGEEFSMHIMHAPSQMIPELADYLRRNRRRFSALGDRRESLGDRLKNGIHGLVHAMIPFVENLICFIPFFMLNNRAVGNELFQDLDFYLLYVLLFAIVHGQQQAIFSSLLAIAGYCFRQMYNRSGFDVILDYHTYVWMVQLLILGFTVGYMRDRLRSIKDDYEGEISFLKKQLRDMSDINRSNVRVKDVLSDHLINQNDSMGKIYEITTQLNQYQPAEVLFYAAEVLGKIMRSGDVAVYTVANRSYARLFSSTSANARKLGNSINYTEMTEMYEALAEHRVYINKKMDAQYPLMADAIYAEGEEMQLILMVWDIPWERMTLGQADMLAITGYLIQNAVLRSNRYIAALSQQRYISDTHILEPEAFRELVEAFLRARSRNLTSCALLAIDLSGMSEAQADEKLAKLVRQTDYVGKVSDGELQVLLANTDASGVGVVRQRFEEAGFVCQIEETVRA